MDGFSPISPAVLHHLGDQVRSMDPIQSNRAHGAAIDNRATTN